MHIPAIRPFGYEAEFVTNGAALAPALQSRRLWGASDIHHYHCNCDYCRFGDVDSSAFRLQSDSSLGSGGVEVISDVQRSWRGAVPLMEELQAALVENDVEPGMRAGLHVHVQQGTRAQQNATIWQFARMEPALLLLANGPHERMRDFNVMFRPLVRAAVLENNWCEPWRMNLDTYRFDMVLDEVLAPDIVQCRNEGYYPHDRHANFNPFTGNRTPTVEFRLWNSTRSAWRMELACRVSNMFASNDTFLGRIATIEVGRPDDERDAEEVLVDLAAAIGASNDRAGELVERQLRFNQQGTFARAFAA